MCAAGHICSMHRISSNLLESARLLNERRKMNGNPEQKATGQTASRSAGSCSGHGPNSAP